MLVQADVLSWCKDYEGDKFHALLCDPPYHLTDIHTGGKAIPNKFGQRTEEEKAARAAERKRGGFMGQQWDGGDIAFQPSTWAALAEHLYDGAFIMAFASSRGWHRQAVAMEDAGLIMHPSIFGWAYGSGFPKATRIDTQVDKAAGEFLPGTILPSSRTTGPSATGIATTFREKRASNPQTDLAKAWQGHRYGLQALKPAVEPILVFQKPYKGKPVECITRTGAGALNIDGARIDSIVLNSERRTSNSGKSSGPVTFGVTANRPPKFDGQRHNPSGRWPANLVLSHTPECKRVGVKKVRGGPLPYVRNVGADKVSCYGEGMGHKAAGHLQDETYVSPDGTETIAEWECPEYCPVRRLGEQSGVVSSGSRRAGIPYIGGNVYGKQSGISPQAYTADTGTAARFFFQADYELENTDPVFYCAKASRSERDAGLEGLPLERAKVTNFQAESVPYRMENGVITNPKAITFSRNNHPTVKPIKLAQHLATLLLPPKEYAPRRLLVPFAGVGSEMIGAILAGWEEVVGIELSQEYAEIAEARIVYWQERQLKLC